MRRLLSFLLSILLVFGNLSPAFAEEFEEETLPEETLWEESLEVPAQVTVDLRFVFDIPVHISLRDAIGTPVFPVSEAEPYRYALLPGLYFYDATAEGYTALENQVLEVSDASAEMLVPLALIPLPAEATEEETEDITVGDVIPDSEEVPTEEISIEAETSAMEEEPTETPLTEATVEEIPTEEEAAIVEEVPTVEETPVAEEAPTAEETPEIVEETVAEDAAPDVSEEATTEVVLIPEETFPSEEIPSIEEETIVEEIPEPETEILPEEEVLTEDDSELTEAVTSEEPEETVEASEPDDALATEEAPTETEAEESEELDPEKMTFGSPADLIPLSQADLAAKPWLQAGFQADVHVPTQAEAYSAMIALKSSYPEGKRYTNDDFYAWNGGVYSGGYGCAGFAFMLSDAAFGTLPARVVTPVTISALHVGDILRVNSNTHSVIILEVYSDHVIIAEGNYNSSVHWGRSLSASEVERADYYMTRYPVGHFTESYTITYDANGGQNAPSSQLKGKGEALVLSFVEPTRLFYKFAGWSTSKTATTATYKPGDTFTANKNTTLYAVWKTASSTTVSNSFPKTYSPSVKRGGDSVLLKFTPGNSGTYIFESKTDTDTKAYLYKEDGTNIAFNDDSGEGRNFRIQVHLDAETTYCLSASFYNNVTTGALPIEVSAEDIELFNTPKVSSVSCTASGVKVSWDAVPGAAQYRILYKEAGGSWKKSGTTASTSYTVKELTSGTKYYFTVRCTNKAANCYTSKYDSKGKAITFYAAPVVTSAQSSGSGVTIKWEPVTGASAYRVMYKTSSGSWKYAETTSKTSYQVTGLTNDKSYTFTVRVVSTDGKTNLSSYYSSGITTTYKASAEVSVVNAPTGVSVSWKEIPGIAKYRVMYKTGSGSWKKAADTTKDHYTVTGLTSGTKYYFTVRLLASDGKTYVGTYNQTGKSITYKPAQMLSTPVLSSVSNSKSGVSVKWNAVTGANKYRVYYKTGSGSWTKAGDTSKTSYTVTGLDSGTKYSFSVRCIISDGNATLSSYAKSKSVTYIAAPVLTSVTNAASGVTVKWQTSPNAAKYRVLYKTGSGSWKKAGETTSTSYTVTGLTSGTAYSFTVRCINEDGTAYTSGYDSTGLPITYLGQPVLSSVSNVSNGIKVKWGAVSGAEKYRVLYKVGTGSWVKAGDTTGTSFTVSGLTYGTKYRFTVQCVSADGTSAASSYSTTGKTITYKLLTSPQLTDVSMVADGILVSWNSVSGAGNYRVLYKTGSGSWTKAADTASTSYTVTGLTPGAAYSFTVRCISDDGKAYISDYDTTGLSIVYDPVLAPVITSLRNVSDGVRISWEPVNSVWYCVQVRAVDNSMIYTYYTSDTNLKLTGLNNGTEYAFTVFCVESVYGLRTSPFSETLNLVYTPDLTPILKQVSLGPDGVWVEWEAVAGVDNYRVYYKTGTGSWRKAGDTHNTKFLVTDLTEGLDYRFTVRCLSSDGQSFRSEYDSDGLQLQYERLEYPDLTDITRTANGIFAQWTPVNGEGQYRLVASSLDRCYTLTVYTSSTSYTFTSLQPGEYEFYVYFVYSDGTRSPECLSTVYVV